MQTKRIIGILRWPETKTNGMVPWYVILYRTIFVPVIYAGLVITWAGIAFANGINAANRFWRNAT